MCANKEDRAEIVQMGRLVRAFTGCLSYQSLTGFKQARLCKIQGLFKDFSDFPTVFKA